MTRYDNGKFCGSTFLSMGVGLRDKIFIPFPINAHLLQRCTKFGVLTNRIEGNVFGDRPHLRQVGVASVESRIPAAKRWLILPVVSCSVLRTAFSVCYFCSLIFVVYCCINLHRIWSRSATVRSETRCVRACAM